MTTITNKPLPLGWGVVDQDKQNETVQIFAYIPTEDAELLKKYAISKGLKRSDLMQQVITYFVKKTNE